MPAHILFLFTTTNLTYETVRVLATSLLFYIKYYLQTL